MANLIRLKQIESGSALNTAATVGNDFSASVQIIVSQSFETQFSQSIVNIILNNVATVLPDGVISSSAQVDITQATNFVDFSSSISTSFENVYIELANITGSLETGLSASVASTFSQSNAIFNEFSSSIYTQISASFVNTNDISASVNERLTNLESFSSSLDNVFATDIELEVTASNLNIDMGEF